MGLGELPFLPTLVTPTVLHHMYASLTPTGPTAGCAADRQVKPTRTPATSKQRLWSHSQVYQVFCA